MANSHIHQFLGFICPYMLLPGVEPSPPPQETRGPTTRPANRDNSLLFHERILLHLKHKKTKETGLQGFTSRLWVIVQVKAGTCYPRQFSFSLKDILPFFLIYVF
ncbi:hypothetical protein KP509_37G054800 [Ceratopteris richardii]|uniref:Uncharacterized protein n=1 Tax=Ceratopteris richardii TaxID=49495 RepID=A0A8T2Q973_CERRI|nr:hypothetical protein KP509_37G054800 [Ceratopteris richardii]